jgi:hypothetical protein
VLELELQTSALLRASVDERRFNVWEFARDGEFVRHREHKDELERLVASVLAETPAEQLRDLARSDQPLIEGSTFRGFERFDPDNGDLRVIAVRQIEHAVHEAGYRLFDAAYLPATPSDRACRTVPRLFERLETADLLLPLTSEMVREALGWDDRVICVDGFALFPHPALRPARELVQGLCALAAAGRDVRIAIDPHAVIPITDVESIGLFDYWYGMKLTLDGLDDPHVIGVTVHARRPDQQDEYMAPLLRTEFRWSSYGASQKSLQVQETVPRSAVLADHGYAKLGSQYVQNRYLHSIRDIPSRSFIHLDGAAKAFRRETYGPTASDPMADQGDPIYRKLFRIDGELGNDAWARLVTHYLRGNELVIEYFGELVDEREPGMIQKF